MKLQHVENIVDKHGSERGSLIAILSDIQSTYSYLPEEALRTVAQKTGKSLVDVYGVATFYRSFSLKPRGKHLCSVCVGTACHVRGSERVAHEFEQQLQVKPGNTTSDRQFTLEHVNCLGACALGPIVVVDGHYFSNVKTTEVKRIVGQAREGLDTVEVKTDQRVFPLDVSCPRCNHGLMDPENLVDGYPPIRVTISFERKHGWLLLSCLYGSFNSRSEHAIPLEATVHVFCPHCHAELSSATPCASCGATMVPMIVRQGGVLQVCSRHGCREHVLDLDGVNL
ncbi:MAG: NAD(P)H-dependent oxidoreductase subunit E [Deltaproteobacteria bacterium]|nr:NAD(P)H-dependent oxidoreductase subunit E [Deltaproteobacteria bacterium]